ncbi:MAG: GIY-YIG nuclease family protein [Candidatus Heimdallarchaeota archaeon]|nr:GIY-YIG nuclease family protein [Candidatus Heimdallarchaeota archaeon]
MKEIINEIPDKPGVYFFLADTGLILYIGKSVSLKKRITDHFRNIPDKLFKKVLTKDNDEWHTPMHTWDYTAKYLERIPSLLYDKERKKKERIISKTKMIKYIITDTEDEALTLEGSLISIFRPEINRMSWRYPFIEITLGEKIPRILTSYQPLDKESYIFGPFNIASNIDLAMEGFFMLFPVCNSESPIDPNNRHSYSCFRYQVNRCLAPCKNPNWNPIEYHQQIDLFISELENNGQSVIKMLNQYMEEAIEVENYEGAAIIRDRIQAIEELFTYKAMPSLLKKYYKEIAEITTQMTSYIKLVDKLLENNQQLR